MAHKSPSRSLSFTSPAGGRGGLRGRSASSCTDDDHFESGRCTVSILSSHIQVEVTTAALPSTVRYMLDLKDKLKDFVHSLQEDLLTSTPKVNDDIDTVALPPKVEVCDRDVCLSLTTPVVLAFKKSGLTLDIDGVKHNIVVTEGKGTHTPSTQGSGKMKYVLVSGGVLSGIGKGITASSIGVLLKGCGLKVTSIKIDPYLNTDAGTMSPFEHGEVFVLDDGGEADLDLGNYERFLDITLTRDNNITTGKMYARVIEMERRGDYLGKTVQVVPHVTNCIQEWIERVARIPVDGTNDSPDVCVIELGGTVGDIESMPFIEALRQLTFKVGSENISHVHVSLVPVMGPVGEQKSKPTQHGVKSLRSFGLQPDIIACRSAKPLELDARRKLANYCQIPETHVLTVHDVPSIFHVPLVLHAQNAAKILTRQLGLPYPKGGVALDKWNIMAHRNDQLSEECHIAVVGKYTGLQDSYLSVIKALEHAALGAQRKLVIDWIEASDLETGAEEKDEKSQAKHRAAWVALRGANGILVPGGYGERGIEGKVIAACWARTNKTPYLGVCLGMQIAVIEYARNVLGWQDANSAEIDERTSHPVVIYMPEISKTQMGGTMRLGSRKTVFMTTDCITSKLYGGAKSVDERHRHRYEVNPEYVPQLEKAGLYFTGQDEAAERMEVIELKDHPFFVGCQYHPEFKSRPAKPSPPFLGLLLAASGQKLPGC